MAIPRLCIVFAANAAFLPERVASRLRDAAPRRFATLPGVRASHAKKGRLSIRAARQMEGVERSSPAHRTLRARHDEMEAAMRRGIRIRSIGLLLGTALVLTSCAAEATTPNYALAYPCPAGAICSPNYAYDPDFYGSLEFDDGWGGWHHDWDHHGRDHGFHGGFGHAGGFGHGGFGGHGGGGHGGGGHR
jgi:hypothetical protein